MSEDDDKQVPAPQGDDDIRGLFSRFGGVASTYRDFSRDLGPGPASRLRAAPVPPAADEAPARPAPAAPAGEGVRPAGAGVPPPPAVPVRPQEPEATAAAPADAASTPLQALFRRLLQAAPPVETSSPLRRVLGNH
ncbi:hypothetical protein [Xanthomonas massiliensis]|jgi:hypothetical protein|uniref:hypothetical protein n=1 Tax=Xanthomonas massiliensis TaxID=1720302 RepID=UPI0008259175|nr:hypothetical protein [Xanthomonas massiliensis]